MSTQFETLYPNFEKDVFMLPITLFSKRFYLKFSQDHIQQFIEVWNNN